MNLYFFDNFDTDSVGALPAWLANIAGTWQVANDPTDAVSTSNVLKTASHGDGDRVLILGGSGVIIPATADITFQYNTKNPGSGPAPMVRSDSSGQNYYVWVIVPGTTTAAQLYKSVGGSLSTIGGQTTIAVDTASGTPVVHIKASAIGTIIGLKIWTGGNAEPGSPQWTQTDSSITAAGYAGFYHVGTSSLFTVDDLTVYGNSSFAAGSISSSSITSSSATLTATAASGGTSPYTYKWYRSTSQNFVPQTANLVSGATSLTLNDSGLSAATTYCYQIIATDNVGAIAWSSQASINTPASSATDFTLTPSSQTTTPGAATGNYTITPNGTPSSSVSITLTDASGGGTFTPSSLTFTTAGAKTFTYTPSSGTGGTTKTLTTTASGGFSATHTAACVVSNTAATDFSLAPASLTTGEGTASGNYTVTVLGTLASNETVALSDGGAGGTFIPSSLTFTSANAGTPQTFTYTPAIGQAGNTKTLTASGAGAFTASHTAACVVTSAPGAGTAFATFIGVDKALLSATNATGGSGSFTYQWYRSNVSGSHGSAIVGATTQSLIDVGLASATDYYYSLQYTDTGGGSPSFSAQAHVKTLATAAAEIVGGVGDSIMAGAYSSFETPFNAMLDQMNFKQATKEFTGVNRAISGTTSSDWASTTAGSILLNAVAAFSSAGVTRIVLMLGTNDSKASVGTPTGTYQANISTIIAYLKAHVSTLRTIHLFSSPYQSSASGDLSVLNCGRIIAYSGTLAAVADGTTVFYSQPLASYNLTQNNTSLLRDGIHPTDTGDQTIGGLWAANVFADLNPSGTVGYSRGRVVNGG